MIVFLPDFSIASPGVSSEEIFVGSCVARGVLDPVFRGVSNQESGPLVIRKMQVDRGF